MSVDQRVQRAPLRRAAPHTYFVGRRLFEAAEIYAVSASDVQRLRSRHRYGETSLDWHGSSAARMELSDVLISRVAQQSPSRELEGRFALYVLAQLPDGGFVLDADDVWRWLRLTSDPDDFVPEKQSLADRLRGLFGGRATSCDGGHGKLPIGGH